MPVFSEACHTQLLNTASENPLQGQKPNVYFPTIIMYF